jgi:hypothetical protein
MMQANVIQGQITFGSTKPDGPPRKWMDNSRLNALGWHANPLALYARKFARAGHRCVVAIHVASRYHAAFKYMSICIDA